jgi:hypothetical protein
MEEEKLLRVSEELFPLPSVPIQAQNSLWVVFMNNKDAWSSYLNGRS